MQTIVVLSCLVALASCAAIPVDMTRRVLPALIHEEVHDDYGQYAFRYITAENTVVSERGQLVPTKEGGYVLVIDGQYEYVSPDDGQIYITSYRGGPDGFHVDGKHLPKEVPVPAALL